MKKRRIFAVVMAAVMTLSMVACGEKQTGNDTPTTAPTATTAPTEAPEATPVPTEAPVQEASIDFEDGNFGFAMMKTKARSADNSVLSLASYNGSNALYVENQGGREMYIAFDIDALLGDKVTEVRKITMNVGTEHADGKFAATAGYLYVYTGENLDESMLEGWSVYMAKKNPKEVTFTLPEDKAFTAGNDNYIVLAKDEDLGNVVSSMYIDDIRFFDASGNVIKADTTVVMEAPAGFARPASDDDEDEAATNAVKVAGDEVYAGDWAQSGIVSADVLSQFAGKDITVTLKYELKAGYDYYLYCPMDNSWGKFIEKTGLTVKTAAEEGVAHHLQGDGYIVVDDWTATELTYTLSAADVDAAIAAGGLSGQTYGVSVYEIVISSAATNTIKEKVAGDEVYAGDWAQSGIVSADVLSKFAGMDLTVTLKYELKAGYDYYLYCPMDNSWGKFIEKTGLTVKTAAEEGVAHHLQGDGYIVVDDWTATELTYTLSAADVDAAIAAGGLSGQTYGVTVYEIVLEAEAPAVEVIKEKVAGDEVYAGDWAQSGIVSADALSKFAGMDLTVTLKYELKAGYDYYLYCPMDNSWGKFIEKTGLPVKTAAEEGVAHHLQGDGYIVVDDWTATELTYTLSAADVDAAIAAGGLSGQTYGVTVYEIVLKAEVPVVETVKEKVAGDEVYAGDWAQSGIVSADALSKFAGMDLTVTLKYELKAGYDYYLYCPMDNSWGKFIEKTGFPVKTAAEEGVAHHLQGDGYIVVDDLTATKLVYTLSAADVDAAIAAGGLSGQTYGVTVYEIVLEGTPAASAPATDTPAVEEPAAPAGPVVEGNTVTIVDGTWWTEAPLTIEQLLGDVDPATVKSVTFTGTTDFTLAYTNNSGNGTVADNPYWTQLAGATTYTATDIDFSNYLLKLCLSKGDNVEYTITWTVE